MESGNKSKADMIKNNENTETEINWEDFKEDDDIFVATFVAHALQKQKVRERFIDGRKNLFQKFLISIIEEELSEI